MKRRKKGHHFKVRSYGQRQFPYTPAVEVGPEEYAGYLRLAEQEVLPLIREHQFGPGVAHLVLALHVQVLLSGNDRVTPESMMTAENRALGVWKAGYYTPGPEYPFTLEEALLDIQQGPKAKDDYASSFQPFTAQGGPTPAGLGEGVSPSTRRRVCGKSG